MPRTWAAAAVRGGRPGLAALDELEEQVTRRYPRGMAVQLEAPGWVSQHDAARELGVFVLRIGVLIRNGRLEPARTAAGEMGVTRGSLDEEKRRRQEASPLTKAARSLKDALRWV